MHMYVDIGMRGFSSRQVGAPYHSYLGKLLEVGVKRTLFLTNHVKCSGKELSGYYKGLEQEEDVESWGCHGAGRR